MTTMNTPTYDWIRDMVRRKQNVVSIEDYREFVPIYKRNMGGTYAPPFRAFLNSVNRARREMGFAVPAEQDHKMWLRAAPTKDLIRLFKRQVIPHAVDVLMAYEQERLERGQSSRGKTLAKENVALRRKVKSLQARLDTIEAAFRLKPKKDKSAVPVAQA
mgnify:CR=1 FL=1